MTTTKERLRAPVQWFGGKGNMLAKLMPLVPEGGRPYCEPYMGAASLFFARDPAPVEVLNDLDQDLVESPRVLWRLRDLSAGVFGLRGELLIIPILSLGGWDVSDGLKESLVIEPGHPFEGGQFEGVHCFPGRPAVD